jgi:DNA-directed RNA polymerase specialized sigma24 family protein
MIDRQRWRDLADGLGGGGDGDRVQSSKNLQPMQTAVGNYLDIDSEITYLRGKRDEIIKVIESLPPKEYKVIYAYYVEFDEDVRIKEVAYHFDKSYDWVKKHKRSALNRIQAILDEKKGANH